MDVVSSVDLHDLEASGGLHPRAHGVLVEAEPVPCSNEPDGRLDGANEREHLGLGEPYP